MYMCARPTHVSCATSYVRSESIPQIASNKTCDKTQYSVKSTATSCAKVQEGLHFVEHGIVIRTTSRTGDATGVDWDQWPCSGGEGSDGSTTSVMVARAAR